MGAANLTLIAVLATVAQQAIPEPPTQNRPREFTGGIGSFRAELLLSAKAVEVDEPFTLTVRIRAKPGKPVHQPPGRPDLKLDDTYPRLFHIDIADPPQKQVDPGIWEFYYLLRAKSDEITEVPDLQFVYFDPGLNPNAYQRTYADAVPLKVTAQREVETDQGMPLPSGPGSLYSVVSGAQVRARWAETLVPGAWLLVAVVLLPPLGCVVWYWVWRRLNPDAARRAVLRRSRAANEALHALTKNTAVPAVEQVLTHFLQQRFDLPVQAPTPLEAMTYLMKTNLSLESVQQTGQVYRALAAARFGPTPVGQALEEDVRELITTLENESWRASLS